MIDFAQLQDIVRERLERDRAVQSVETVGPTLEMAVADASALLEIPIRHIEYEIIERGSAGFLGIGKKDWRIQAYEHYLAKKKKQAVALFEDDDGSEFPVIENRDGEVFVHLQYGGDALIKVTPASGNGRKASEMYAMQFLRDRKVADINAGLVSKVVNEASGKYVKVGTFEHLSYNDSVIRVETSEDEMKAYIDVKAPEDGGCDISYETYISTLRMNHVVHGIREEFLESFVDQPIYGEMILVAEGTLPVDGKNAYIQFNFETDQSKARLKERSDGRIDFKELNIIQNVVEYQPVAKKMPPETGAPGKTVTGRWLTAKDGVDINLPLGENVQVAEDNETIISTINGRVILNNGLISVDPVYIVEGDVNLKTGNIIFNGTVIIKGNVEDSFSVKATGDIEVNGTVAKSDLYADGKIIISQGINAKGGGRIYAGTNLWARFIQNANIHCGGIVMAADGIINSYVVSNSRIICNGKRANIMGGRLCAYEEINAKVLGNPTSGTETILEVGFDPKSKEELDMLVMERETTTKLLEETKLSIQTLINIKQQRKDLPEDKEAFLQELMDKRNNLTVSMKKLEEGIKKIQEYLSTLKSLGKVSASHKVYPGVKIVIKDVRDEVLSEYKAVTFVLEGDQIKVTKYVEPDLSEMKGMDGYTTN